MDYLESKKMERTFSHGWEAKTMEKHTKNHILPWQSSTSEALEPYHGEK